MVWQRGKYFLWPWLLFFLVGVGAVLLFGKADLHVALNIRQPRSADAFFRTITLFGEGISLGLALFYLFFRSRYAALFLASSWLTSVVTIQVLKHFFEALRPASVFKDTDLIYFVEGVTYRFSHSFPSGHTGDVFSVCFALTLLSAKPKYGFLLFVPALLVGYSRVFLSQHFLEDILAGSFIAILCTSINYWLWWRNSPAFRKYIDRR